MLTLFILYILVGSCHLPWKINSSFDSTTKIIHQLLINSSPWKLNIDNHENDFFVKCDCIWVLLYLVEKIKNAIPENLSLSLIDSPLIGVKSVGEIGFDGGEQHDK